MDVRRGHVYWVKTQNGEKSYLVVSNNGRNRALDTCVGVRITTSTAKPNLPSIVKLDDDAPLKGVVLCDEMTLLHHDNLERYGGSLSLETMVRVGAGLRAALSL